MTDIPTPTPMQDASQKPEPWPAPGRKPTHHHVGKILENGEVCIYVGKPKVESGWVNDQPHRSMYYMVTMGYRRPDGSTYRERYIQPIFDTFTPGKQ